jgi:hypothetical protein
MIDRKPTDSLGMMACGYRRSFRACVALFTVALSACLPSHDQSKRSRAVVLLRGASHVEYASFGDSENIAYDLPSTAPLEQARDAIDRDLSNDGWRRITFPLSTDEFIDARTGSEVRVQQWRGTWGRDARVAEYILEERRAGIHVWGGVGPLNPGDSSRRKDSQTSRAISPVPDPRMRGIRLLSSNLCEDSALADSRLPRGLGGHRRAVLGARPTAV